MSREGKDATISCPIKAQGRDAVAVSRDDAVPKKVSARHPYHSMVGVQGDALIEGLLRDAACRDRVRRLAEVRGTS
jgi:hypothetical protein